jgi:hypothetical protein
MTDWTRPDPKLVVEAIREPGFELLTRADIDLAVAASWDNKLVRRQRLLVPVDVQAYVVPDRPTESTVAVAGLPTDPAPFDAGTARSRGVHLHWALPDSLLRGRQVDADAIGDAVEFPLLPDRWVVVRTVLPIGRERALVRGWVIDATTKVVTPLAEFSGTPSPPADATDRLDRLDASFGGGLLWTASYEASAGRFGFHDTLDDLDALKAVAPSGLHGDSASYTVAGWWSDAAVDALAGSTGTAAVDARLASLGWYVDHEGRVELFTRDAQFDIHLMEGAGFSSVDDQPKTTYALQGMKKTSTSPQADVQVANPIDDAGEVIIGPARLSYLSLLHGSVLGVPLGGLPATDGRPPAASVSAVVGLDIDDLFAAFGASGVTSQPAQRELAERLAAAFTGDLLEQLDQPDGLADLAEREHNDGFWPLAGPPLSGVQPDILRAEDSAAVNPMTVGRKGRGATVGSRKTGGKQAGAGRGQGRGQKGVRVKAIQFVDRESASDAPTKPPRGGLPDDRPPTGSVRSVTRPAPRVFRPQAPMIGLRNARPSLRHHGDGLHDDTGRLRCRYPSEAGTSYEGVLRASELIPTLGSGAIPPEVLTVAREALLLDPYAEAWHAAATARGNTTFESAVRIRLSAEYARLYGTEATYSGSGSSFMVDDRAVTPRASSGGWKQRAGDDRRLVEAQISAEVSKMSTFAGTMPSPVAITTWRQPWVPLWLEWEVRLRGGTSLDSWRLGQMDLEPDAAPNAAADTIDRTLVGRSAVGRGAGIAIQAGINRWLDAERKRDTAGQSTLNAADQRALGELANLRAPLDLVSASMDGVREQLLGLDYVGQIERDPGTGLPVAPELPVPLFGGALEVVALRLVDAFGRTLDIDTTAVATTTTLEITSVPSTIRLRPRLQHSARWLFRLVDPAYQSATNPQGAREAFVNQSRPDLGVNPIAGYLLPDHIDEALELFDTSGAPLGQLDHDGLSGAVRWETAPGRPLPPDAGPLADLAAPSRLMGQIALGLGEVDVASRQLAEPPGDTPLTALLRAIDTTLWTVDTMAAVGTPSIAGLVSRPVAVVRATLRLDVLDDVAEVHITHAGGATERLAAFQDVDRQRFAVRLGDLSRTDDGLLGFFVDDDYRRFHVVDRVVAAQAIDSGRHRGHLGLHGAAAAATVRPLDSPYIVAEDELLLRPGETVQLTLLMLPGGRVHLTSGILPRKALALADDWVRLGLQRIVPSVRVGPLLIDPGDVRLPKVHTLGESQSFIRRTGPLTWREDPIISATSAALLPRLPHELAEGWIRVTPEEADA